MQVRFALLALLLPCSLAVTAHAAPSKTAPPPVQPKNSPAPKTYSGPAPTPKFLPINEPFQPKKKQPISNNTKLFKAHRKPKVLTKTQVTAIAGRFSIPADPNGVKSPKTLTVRAPYFGPGAYMTFPHSDGVLPEAYPSGVASISGRGSMRRVRGTGPEITSTSSQDELNAMIDPLNPGFPEDAEVMVEDTFLGIHFEAMPNRDYVVSCRVSKLSGELMFTTPSDANFAARVAIDGGYSHVIREMPADTGRVSMAIPRAAAKRGIDIQLVAYRAFTSSDAFGLGAYVAGQHYLVPFSVSRCDIIPIE